MQRRLRVLFLPAWYPSDANPIAGIFVKEHAKAASLYNDVIVLYVYPDPCPRPKGLYRLSEDVEDGITTIRVQYGGILSYAKARLLAVLGRSGERRGGNREDPPKGNSLESLLKKTLRLPVLLAGAVLYYSSVFAAFRRILNQGWKPDIIHAHVFSAGVPAVVLGKLYRTPVVITEHYTNFATHSLTFLERRRAKFSMGLASFVLPVSEDLARAIESYYGISNKFRVVPNAVDTQAFCPLADPGPSQRSNQKRMLLVANMVPRKGLPYLLQALSEMKDARHDFVLDVVGEGPSRSEYEELAAKLGLQDNVTFYGRQPQIAPFMRACDFFVLPSTYENFGVVYIEAMACGKPVIATNAGGPREIVNEDAGVLVPPRDVEALKRAIEYMLDNYQKYSPERISRYAREKFSYETVGRLLDEVYRQVVDS